MKPYILVEGNNLAIEDFEQKIAKALEMGYSLAGELVAQAHSSGIKLYQPLILEEEDEDEEYDDEEEEEEDD